MNTREQAIEAAARALWATRNNEPWIPEWADRERLNADAAAALAAAVPVLLNDLADRIEARRDDYAWHSPELAICAAQHNIAIEFAVRTVRASAEGWGQ